MQTTKNLGKMLCRRKTLSVEGSHGLIKQKTKTFKFELKIKTITDVVSFHTFIHTIPFSVSVDLGILLSPVGGGVEAPWFGCESRWRIVWLMKKRHRPTGED